MATATVRVLNYHPAAVWIEQLRAAGYAVDVRPLRTPADLKAIGGDPPAAVAIDLSRAPSQGRDFGLGIRQQASSRTIPLVFVGGSPARVAQIRALVPDAVCTSDGEVLPAVRRAIARPPAEGVRPASVLAGYAGTLLPRKLGIKPGTVVRLLNAPPGFETTLGDLPEGARVTRCRGGACDLTLWFVPRRRDLEEGLGRVAGAVTTDRLWIVWPKKTSPLAADVSQREVRSAGLHQGLVDYKICAVDDDWSGLLFSRRKPGRGR